MINDHYGRCCPSDKLSVRSTGNYNYSNLPSKTSSMKTSTDYVSSTPIRLGEMETVNSSIIGSVKPIIDLCDKYGINTEDRNKLVMNLLTTDPFNPDISFESNTKGNNNKIFESLLLSIGIKLNVDVDKPKEDEYANVFKMNDDEIKEYLDKLIEENPSKFAQGISLYNTDKYVVKDEDGKLEEHIFTEETDGISE